MAIDPRFLSAPALSTTQPVNPKVDPKKAWEAARKFEQTFVSSVLQQILKGTENGMFGGGEAEEMFRSLWTEKIAGSMNFGIAESVYPSLLKTQEKK